MRSRNSLLLVGSLSVAQLLGCTRAQPRTGPGATPSPVTPSTVSIVLSRHDPGALWAAERLANEIRARGCNAEAVCWSDIPLLRALFGGDRKAPESPSTGVAFVVSTSEDVVREPLPENRFSVPPGAGTYALWPVSGDILGGGPDGAGSMYALLDLAERVRLKGLDGLRLDKGEVHQPAVAFRAVNPFLSIPLADKDGQRDWEHWWFTDEEYWRGYLDLLAKARINWIDMHGMCDIQVTSFPNMWPYFVVSEKYPDVGVPPEQARNNLAMLQKVCRMAKERGIKLGIMNYTGGWNWPGCRKAPERPAADFIEYTKEGLKQIVQACPDLGMIGFRIGESGYGEDFYAKSYVAALEELGRPLPLYTRTWGAKKDKLMELGKMYPDKFIIEIKYNGEQMGPPWHVAGGRMAGWRDYSYQNYLFYPRQYKVVWQIRANGTHRIFQWASYEHIRACVQTTTLADSAGFCVEPMSTYYPVTDFFHKEPLFRWEYERNPLWYLMWGRLAYDPQTPEDVFRLAGREHWGAEHGDKAYELLQSMSRIVPTAKTQFSLGPDHRDHAPELEWGGSIRQWARGLPFDTYFAMGPTECVRELISGDFTGRRDPLRAVALLTEYASTTGRLLRELPDGSSKSVDDLKLDARMAAALARYYAARLMAAFLFAASEWLGDAESADANRSVILESQTRWRELGDLGDQYYRPFLDTLRMHTQQYLWSQALPNFERDNVDLHNTLISDVPSAEPHQRPHGDGRNLTLRVRPSGVDTLKDKQTLTVRAAVDGLTADETIQKVNLLWKRFRSEAAWQRIPMALAGSEWTATVEIDSEGALYGLEVITNQNATIAPVDGVRPYGVINPWPVH